MAERLSRERIERFLADAAAHGVHVKWFGQPRAGRLHQPLSDMGAISARHRACRGPMPCWPGLCDMRVPLALDEADCDCIAAVLTEASRGLGAGVGDQPFGCSLSAAEFMQ